MTDEAKPVPRRRGPLFALLAANAVSMSGNVAALVAIPWFVLQTTGSPARTGIVAAAGLVPIVLSGFIGGALVDRLGYRKASIVADLAVPARSRRSPCCTPRSASSSGSYWCWCSSAGCWTRRA